MTKRLKNKNHKFGLVLYRHENEELVRKIVNVALKKYTLKNHASLGHIGRGWIGKKINKDNRKYSLWQIPVDAFHTYRDFDDFLITLAIKLNDLQKLGLVLGHNDNDGFFWMDYYSDVFEGALEFGVNNPVLPHSPPTLTKSHTCPLAGGR